MPLIRRIPKRGFKSRNRVEYQVVNVRDLDRVDGDVSPESMRAAGLIGSMRKPVKVLGLGEVEKKLTVHAHKFSATAQAKIEAAGGTVSVIGSSSSDA
jgi:large subunit ribosomal protein L15